jgi:hypothetical protein
MGPYRWRGQRPLSSLLATQPILIDLAVLGRDKGEINRITIWVCDSRLNDHVTVCDSALCRNNFR